MNVSRGPALALFLLLTFPILSSTQKQAPPPPQTPRQALIEMINGGAKGAMKHLTVEVQELLSKPENKQAAYALGMFDSIKGQAEEMQLFETGPELFSMNDPRQHEKIEVNVDNDDMSGDQDALELSVHMFRDGQEQNDQWGYFGSRVTVSMARQQGIWRLSKIEIGIGFPVGDPEFLKKTFLRTNYNNGATGVGVVLPDVHTTVKAEGAQTSEAFAQRLTTMLGLAEQTFAHQHADVGFTCSLAQLAETAKLFGVDPQISGGTDKGYKITLAGCQGRPTGSFQITVEPIPGKG